MLIRDGSFILFVWLRKKRKWEAILVMKLLLTDMKTEGYVVGSESDAKDGVKKY